MVWKPDVTVAAVIERDARFLLVQERIRGRLVFNQPAGHLEDRESLLDAVVRETLEETAWELTPQWLLGVYQWRSPRGTLHRCASPSAATWAGSDADRPLDPPVIATHWLTRNEIVARALALRSPLVLRCIDDYLRGVRLPLDALTSLATMPR